MTETAGTEASSAGEEALSEYVSSLGLGGDETPVAKPVEAKPAVPGAKPAPAPDDDLSDLDSDKPLTAERIAAIKDRLVSARERAREETRKANAASARARAQEERFVRTKDKTLDLKQSVENREKMLTAIEAGLFSGDKATVLQTLGHMTKRDPLEVWTEISQAVAGGKIKKNEIPQEVVNELVSLRQQLEQLAAQGPTREKQQMIEGLREQLVTAAAGAAEYPNVARFAARADTREEVRDLLADIKEKEFVRNGGTPIDNATAFGILEGRFKAQSELFQPDHASNGQATVERETASPVLGQAATPGTKAAIQAPSPPPRTIPADLSGRSGGTRRALSERERIAEIARSTPASVFRDMGLGSLLLDGEE
jgi:hypothetical protein